MILAALTFLIINTQAPDLNMATPARMANLIYSVARHSRSSSFDTQCSGDFKIPVFDFRENGGRAYFAGSLICSMTAKNASGEDEAVLVQLSGSIALYRNEKSKKEYKEFDIEMGVWDETRSRFVRPPQSTHISVPGIDFATFTSSMSVDADFARTDLGESIIAGISVDDGVDSK
jgi:hypothetical protein